MSQFNISSIDKSLAQANIRRKLKGLAFEDVSEALRLLLGDNYFIYEGNNHIVVQESDRSDRLVFVERY